MLAADRLIVDAVEKVFAGLGNESAPALPNEAWTEISQSGFLDTMKQSSGCSVADAAAVARAAGRHAVAAPVVETMLTRHALECAGISAPSGQLGIVWCDLPCETGATFARVPWGRTLDALAVLWPDQDLGTRISLIARDKWEIAQGSAFSGEFRDDLTFTGGAPDGEAPIAAIWRGEALQLKGAALRTAQIAGALESVLDITVRYAGQRNQFGRPIGAFQAVQHLIATLAGEVAAGDAAATLCVDALDSGRMLLVASAKLRAGEAAGRAAALSHQVHGAIGLTAEYALHRWTTRLESWRSEYGDETYWARWIGERVRGVGAEGIWEFVTRGGDQG